MKIYTKTGDDGSTGLSGGTRVRKDALRIEAIGSVDEVNAALGLVHANLEAGSQSARGWLDQVQSDLFVVGALLATPPEAQPAKVELKAARIGALEEEIDHMEKELSPLQNFILPQGTPSATLGHLARSVSRRAERRVVALAASETVNPLILVYLNRLSDFLFVLARWINRKEGGTETAWLPREGGSGAPTLEPIKTDRLGDTLRKLEEDKVKRKTLFEKASIDLQKRRDDAERSFRQGVDQIKKDGGKVEKPLRDVDLD